MTKHVITLPIKRLVLTWLTMRGHGQKDKVSVRLLGRIVRITITDFQATADDSCALLAFIKHARPQATEVHLLYERSKP